MAVLERLRLTLSGLIVSLVAANLAGVIIEGQTRPAPAKAPSPTRTNRTVPRTPWGHPDLQGLWSNATTTPLERPSTLGDRQVLSDEERADLDRRVSDERNTDRAPRAGDPGTYNEFWWERGGVLNQTAIIVDPASGKVPALTAQGQAAVARRRERVRGRGPADSWEDRNLHERCILYHGVPPLPTGYNNNYHIAQTPEYVAIRYEMLAETRIIPLDGRPHVGSTIRQWMGDPRGRWEGDTLVVETTNFNAAAGGLYELGAVTDLQGTGETLRVVERFTRIDPDTIDYRFTVDDTAVFSTRWTGSLPLRKFAGPIFEYACHEGNYAMEHMLSGARAEERNATKNPTGPR